MILPKEAVNRIIFSDTRFLIILSPSLNEFTINWSRNKIDTFKMELTSHELECCGSRYEVRSLSNQDSIINHSRTIKVVVP